MADLISHLLDGQFVPCSGTVGGTPNSAIVLVSPSYFYGLVILVMDTGQDDMGGNFMLGSLTNDPSMGLIENNIWDTSVSTLAAYNNNVFVIMQADGNLCAYYGSDPDNKRSPAYWCTGSGQGAGQYHITLHDDGLLAIYTGHAVGQGTQIWTSGATDPVVSIDWSRIWYDFSSVTIEPLDPLNLYSDTLENGTGSPAQVIVKGQEDAPETLQWTETQIVADTSSVQIAALSATAPRIINGKVVAGDTSETGNMNEENESGRTWQWYETVTIPADSALDVSVTVQVANITVPFTANTLLTFKSGEETYIRYKGVYSGITSHDMQFTTSTPD